MRQANSKVIQFLLFRAQNLTPAFPCEVLTFVCILILEIRKNGEYKQTEKKIVFHYKNIDVHKAV